MTRTNPRPRRPGGRLLLLLICMLVLSTEPGCATPNPTSAPTEPTTALDAVYEKLDASLQEIRSREAYHFKGYITPSSPVEADPTQFDYIEFWVHGEDLYEEQLYLGNRTPRMLQYNGKIYVHQRDDIWSLADSTSRTPESLRPVLPSRDSHTMTWQETDGHLDVAFAEKDAHHSGTEIRLDASGKLVWYASYTRATIIQEDGSPKEIRMYTVIIYQDTDPAQIRSHLDTVAPELIADMVFHTPAA